MFEILKYIITENIEKTTSVLTSKKKDWKRRFGSVYYEWDFEKLYELTNSDTEIENSRKQFLRRQIEYFEENL